MQYITNTRAPVLRKPGGSPQGYIWPGAVLTPLQWSGVYFRFSYPTIINDEQWIDKKYCSEYVEEPEPEPEPTEEEYILHVKGDVVRKFILE